MRAQGSVEETSSARVSRRQYKAILTCDLVQEFFLPDFAVLERLTEYMMDNSGKLNSPNNAGSVLHANRVATNHVTVGRCISHLRDAFAHRWRKPATRGLQTACKSPALTHEAAATSQPRCFPGVRT